MDSLLVTTCSTRSAHGVACAFTVSFVLTHICRAATDVNSRTPEVEDGTVVCERRSRDGDMLSIHYVGRLDTNDGTVIDSTRSSEPFVFQLGRRQVLVGLDRGLVGMCVGDRRTVRIPSELAYGSTGSGDRIPPDSDLVFDVELVDIGDAPSKINVFRLMDHDRDGHLSRQEVGDYLRRQIPAAVLEANGDADQLVDVDAFDQNGMVDEIFRHEDKDRNGFISHDEFSGSKHDEL